MKRSYLWAFLFAFAFLTFACLSASCTIDGAGQSGTTTGNAKPENRTVTGSNGYEYTVVVIDSCEYICKNNVSVTSHGYSVHVQTFTHKGNCKFCKERGN